MEDLKQQWENNIGKKGKKWRAELGVLVDQDLSFAYRFLVRAVLYREGEERRRAQLLILDNFSGKLPESFLLKINRSVDSAKVRARAGFALNARQKKQVFSTTRCLA